MKERWIEAVGGDCLTEGWLAGHKFTDNARRMLRHAFERYLDRGSPGEEVPPVMILWSMLRWEPKIGAVILERCGVDLRSLERDVEERLSRLAVSGRSHGHDLGALSRVAAAAIAEAATIGHGYVGSEHLVLALLKGGDESIGGPLGRHGVTYEAYRSKLIEELAHRQAGSSGEQGRS